MRLNDATPEQWDAVSRPEHYNTGSVECIEPVCPQKGSKDT